jgi:hypothetical protein
MKSIYELGLHEVTGILPIADKIVSNDFTVMRVPGGWIYMVWDDEAQKLVREIFIPYDNEFQRRKRNE